jgi:hypothetical protein
VTIHCCDDTDSLRSSPHYHDDEAEFVTGDDTILDGLLGAHLRNIARTLHFMARAKALGIEVDVDNVESLANVSTERWDALEYGHTPKYVAEQNAEVVVEQLLCLTVWELCVLAERTAILRDELKKVGVVFE